MSPAATPSEDPQQAALDDLCERYSQALSLFCDQRHPQWERTQLAMRCFRGLRLDLLPPRWQRRVEISLCRVNAVLAAYSIKTEQDYRQISADDLQRIMDLVVAIPTAR